MTDSKTRLVLMKGLAEIYGEAEGLRMAGTVVPGILNDFSGMLRKAVPGQRVSEEYRLEDGRSVVRLSGRGGDGGSLEAEVSSYAAE